MPTPPPDSPTPALAEVALDVAGMDCASCMAHVTQAALAVPGVAKVDANLARGRAVVRVSSLSLASGGGGEGVVITGLVVRSGVRRR